VARDLWLLVNKPRPQATPSDLVCLLQASLALYYNYYIMMPLKHASFVVIASLTKPLLSRNFKTQNSLLIKEASSFSVASFPGLLSPNAVEGLVKLIRRMTSGGRLEVRLITLCMHNTAVHRKCHASRHPPDVILCTSFTRPSTALGDRRPGNEAKKKEKRPGKKKNEDQEVSC